MLGFGGGGGGGGGGTGGATIAPTQPPSKTKRTNSHMMFIITAALQLPKLELVVKAAKETYINLENIYRYIYIYTYTSPASLFLYESFLAP